MMGLPVRTLYDNLVHICYDALDPNMWPYCTERSSGSPCVPPSAVPTCIMCIALESHERG